MDQTKTDFLKGRSLAIYATKSALEGSGFALPEPIYRVRFDETAPFSVPAQQPAAARPPKAAMDAGSPEVAQDTTPDTHVETLVSEERATGSKGDLLTNQRPVE